MSKEQEGSLPPEERTPQPYRLSARYPDQISSETPYNAAQELIFRNEELELSVFRLQLRRLNKLSDDWFVAIVGEVPAHEHQEQLRQILSGGKDVELPPDVTQALLKRRAELSRLGPWVERHYRGGGRRLR